MDRGALRLRKLFSRHSTRSETRPVEVPTPPTGTQEVTRGPDGTRCPHYMPVRF